jgi:hypothetical protein
MIRVKKVIWEGQSYMYPDDTYISREAPYWRAVFDGDKIKFECASDTKDAMDNFVWNPSNCVPTVFVKKYATELYKKEVENVRA